MSFKGYLPMDGEAVDEDWVTFLCGRLAEALEENEDARGL